MAELSAPRVLLKDNIGAEVFAFSLLRTHKITLSSNEKGISVYCPNEKKIVKSWPCMLHASLTSKVIYEEENHHYVAIFDKKNVAIFNDSDATLADAKFIKTKLTNIASAEPCASSSCIFFVSVTGEIAVAKDSTEPSLRHLTFGKSKKNSRGLLLASEVPLPTKQSPQLMLLIEQPKSYVIRLVSASLNHETDKAHSLQTVDYVVNAPGKCKKALSYLICRYSHNVIILWDNMELWGYPCEKSWHAKEHLSSHEVNGRLLSDVISKDTTTTAKESKVFIGAVGGKYVAVAIQNGCKVVIRLIERMFGTLVTSTSITVTSSTETITKLFCFHNYILLALPSKVMSLECTITENSLARSLGKLPTKTSYSAIGKLPGVLQGANISLTFNDESQKQNSLLNRLAESEKRISINDKHSLIDDYLDNVISTSVKPHQIKRPAPDDSEMTVTPKKQKRDDDVSGSKTNLKDSAPQISNDDSFSSCIPHKLHKQHIVKVERSTRQHLSPPFVEAIFNFLLSNEKCWCSQLVNKLLRLGCVPSSICKPLFDELIKHNFMELIQIALKNIPVIPESTLAECLRLVLSNCITRKPTDHQDSNKSKNKDTNTVITHAPTGFCLSKQDVNIICYIVQSKFNDVPMQMALKDIGIKQSQLLLWLLKVILKVKSPLNGSLKLKMKSILTGVTYQQTLDFIPLVINANVSNFLLDKEMLKTLRTMNAEVKKQMEVYNSLKGVVPYLYHIQKGYGLPDKTTEIQYKYETLKL